MKTSSINYELQYNRRDDSGLRVVGMSHIIVDDKTDWKFPLHSHQDFLELSLTLHGDCHLYCDGKEYTISRGDLIIRNAGVLHSEYADRHSSFEQICLNLSGICIDGNAYNTLLAHGESPVIKTGASFPFLKQLFLYMTDLCERQPAGFEIVLHDTSRALLSSVQLLLPLPKAAASESSAPSVIRDVVQYINDNYTENISLENLSERFFFSPYYLARKFKDETGYTVNQYVINRRMGEAERMLAFEDLDIKEIARRAGYTNIQYFYATFKKYAGCTPVEFRKLYKNNRSDSAELPE